MNERPCEYAFALGSITKGGRALDVGSGKTAFPAILHDCGLDVTAIDRTARNAHFAVGVDDITAPKVEGPFDLITCISVLEHIPEHLAAMAAMRGLLSDDGQIILTVPYYAPGPYIADVYREPQAGYRCRSVCQVFSDAELEQWCALGLEVVESRYWRIFTGDRWTFGERLERYETTSHAGPHHLAGFALRVAP